MPFLLKNVIHKSIADAIIDDIRFRRGNYYYFIGKVMPWANVQQADTPQVTQAYESDTRNKIITIKRITSADAAYIVPRVDWTSNTIYDRFDGDYSPTNASYSGAEKLPDANFYVLTEDFNVYKCIDNNGNAQSTVKPTGTDFETLTTGDGYVWKYLYTVDLGLRNRFLTSEFLPVKKAVSDQFYDKGAVSAVTIDSAGTGYSNSNTTLSLTGDGANASLTPYVNNAGQLIDIIINNPGEGYTYLNIEVVGSGTNANVSASFSSGDVTSPQSTVELSAVDGSIEAFRIQDGGNSYSHANITVTGDGTGFAGSVTVNSNAVSKITVSEAGRGYTFANVQITGDGSNAAVEAIFSPAGGHGKDAVKELFADRIMLYSTINNEKIHNVTVNNDYRQFGILKNPTQYANNKNFFGISGSPCFLVTLNSTTGLQEDSILTLSDDSTRVFEVVEATDTQALLTNLNNYTLAVGDALVDDNTSTTHTITSVDEFPDINKFSGDLLFIDNRTKVSYGDEQLVTLRTVIRV